MKKSLAVAGLVILFFLLCETGAQLYEKVQLHQFPPIPTNEEQFGTLENALKEGNQLSYFQWDFFGNPTVYTPYTVVTNRPYYHSTIANSHFQFNSLGFRAPELETPKPPGLFRVFLLGSSVVSGGITERETISYFLQKDLEGIGPKVEVINAGVAGYMSMNELTLLETEILDLQPDLVIILDGRNDLYCSVATRPTLEQGERELLDNLINAPRLSTLLTQDARYLVRQSRFLTMLFRFFFRRTTPNIYARKAVIKEKDINVYLNNLKMMKAVLEARGVHGMIVFEPTLSYCKDQKTNYEKSVLKYLEETEKTNWVETSGKVWPTVGRKVVGIPNSATVKTHDLSCVFSGDTQTDYADSGHYTTLGLQKIAAALCDLIRKDFPKRSVGTLP